MILSNCNKHSNHYRLDTFENKNKHKLMAKWERIFGKTLNLKITNQSIVSDM